MRFVAICLLCASCGIYKSRFDTPPGKGIRCAPVTEVLDRIVERKDGEDIFIADKQKPKLYLTRRDEVLMLMEIPCDSCKS